MHSTTPCATPSPFSFFSTTYNSGNLQTLCFDHVATVGVGVWGYAIPIRENPRPVLVLLQIRPFIFNDFQDAPPATFFFSCFCIVARGWHTFPIPKSAREQTCGHAAFGGNMKLHSSRWEGTHG